MNARSTFFNNFAGTMDRSMDSADRLVSFSPAMVSLLTKAQNIAGFDSPVMITGDTGTGKERIARFIHESSHRAARPFIPVDCMALNAGLLEQELFGHVQGAFPGATRNSMGCLRASDGGTLYISNIDQLDLPLQSRLFHALRSKSVIPVGGTGRRPVDLRLLTSTRQDIEPMVHRGLFRKDLYLHVSTHVLKTPTLRDRAEDILPLARYFLSVQAELFDETPKHIPEPVAEILQSYHWPGNLRELAEIMQQCHARGSVGTVDVNHALAGLKARINPVHREKSRAAGPEFQHSTSGADNSCYFN